MEFGSAMERFAGRGKHSRSRNEKPQQTSTKLSPIASRKCPDHSKSSRLKAPSMLKATVPKPFRFQTEERCILKGNSNAERSPEQVKVKDGDLIHKPEKMIRKATPTITQPFRFRTEERSFLRAAQGGQLKDKELVVQKQKRTQDEKLSTRIAKIEPDTSVVEKEGTEDEEAKKAYRTAREETDDKAEIAISDKVYSAQIDRVDSMLEKVRNEIDDGDWGKALGSCYDGKVSREEVATATMYLKQVAQELISYLSKDKDGKVLVGDLDELGTQTGDSEVVKMPLEGCFISNEGAENVKKRSISTVPSVPKLEYGGRLGHEQFGQVLAREKKSIHIMGDSKHLMRDLDGGGNELQTQYFFPRQNLGLIPLGLMNPKDNRCYLNSILQVLSFTPPLAQLFLAQMHCSICPIIRGECGVCLLERHVYLAHTSYAELDLPLDALQILTYACKFAGNFVWGRQEDAHELLVGFIGACISCLERLQPVKSPTMFDHIFGGSFLQQVKCHSCRTESNTIQPFLDISLDIINSFSLTQSLQAYFRSELLDGANKYNCNKCCNLSLAEKRVRFLKAPNVLAIHLKRFDVLPGRKINRHIAFGESLDLSNFMSRRSQADPKPVYKLYGVVVHHSSSLNEGHYFSYIKNSDGRWYCCDDSVVSQCTLGKVLSSEAYVLFYSRTNLSQ